MTKLYIDFHDAAINVIVGSNYKLNQFITWDGQKTFFVYEFGTDQQVCEIHSFNVAEDCNLYDAKLHARLFITGSNSVTSSKSYKERVA